MSKRFSDLSVYCPTDKIFFGAYAEATLDKIFKYHPAYLIWAIENIPYFAIDIEAFEQLPRPTPVILKGFYGNYEKTFHKLYAEKFGLSSLRAGSRWKYHTGNDLLRLICEFIKEKNYAPPPHYFKFPDKMKEYNEDKIDMHKSNFVGGTYQIRQSSKYGWSFRNVVKDLRSGSNVPAGWDVEDFTPPVLSNSNKETLVEQVIEFLKDKERQAVVLFNADCGLYDIKIFPDDNSNTEIYWISGKVRVEYDYHGEVEGCWEDWGLFSKGKSLLNAGDKTDLIAEVSNYFRSQRLKGNVVMLGYNNIVSNIKYFP